jgi:hypothetical protein
LKITVFIVKKTCPLRYQNQCIQHITDMSQRTSFRLTCSGDIISNRINGLTPKHM